VTFSNHLRIESTTSADSPERIAVEATVAAWNELVDRLVQSRTTAAHASGGAEAVAVVESSPVTAFLSARANREALAQALFEGVVLDRWSSDAKRKRDWRATVAICRAVARSTTPAEAGTFERASSARDVALRHTGASPSPPALATGLLASLSADDRYAVHAQWLQFAADGDLALVEPRVGHALALDGDGPGWLKLLGAVGRARAALGDYSRASEALDMAIAGWIAIGDVEELSRPLSERLRIAAISEGSLPRMDELLLIGGESLARMTGDPSYLCVALGRALVQIGRRGDGARVLATATADLGYIGYPITAALRWQALADPERAPSIRRLLEEHGGDDQWILARLDEYVAPHGRSGALDAEGLRLIDLLLNSVVEATEHRSQIARLLGGGARESLRVEVVAEALPMYLPVTRY
jgi:hypothetical protein